MALKMRDFGSPGDPMPIACYRFLRDHVLTEEATDMAMNYLAAAIKLKWLPFSSWLIGKVIDPLVPEKILDLIQYLMCKFNLATEEDFRRMDSPLLPG